MRGEALHRNGTRRPYSRHGLTALRAKVQVRGLGALDQRTSAARALVSWRNALVCDMGGEDAVSAAQRAMIDVATRTRLYVDGLDVFLLEQPSLIVGRGKRKTVLPVLLERQRLADSLVSVLGRLGLERRARPIVSASDYLRGNGQGGEDAQA